VPEKAEAVLNFCSNNYLGLSSHPRIVGAAHAALDLYGYGLSSVRFICGTQDAHRKLESSLARFLGMEDAILYSSCFDANGGLFETVLDDRDAVVSDALNHASIIDGARLSRARIEVVPHLDIAAVERSLAGRDFRRALVVTESYFSMDGDSADLRALRQLCDAHGAVLYVDEAHALGVLGPDGRGLCAQAGVIPDVVVGTFGKAFGAGGAFVAGCSALTSWLWNRARSFVFSTGLSPVVAAAALQGMETAAREPWRRAAVAASAALVRRRLTMLGVRLGGTGHIIPWIIGDASGAVRAAQLLALQGLDVRPIRPPTVAPGTARLRLTVTAAHREADIELLVRGVAAMLEEAPPCPVG
jgi:8-amino-7-oxononanoate synthase